MAYFGTNLIARRGYGSMSGLDDVFSAIKSGAGAVLDFYGKTEQQAGANTALAAQNTALTNALAAQAAQRQQGLLGGIDTSTMLILGGGALAAVLLLRGRK